jgi:hypothetical protein
MRQLQQGLMASRRMRIALGSGAERLSTARGRRGFEVAQQLEAADEQAAGAYRAAAAAEGRAGDCPERANATPVLP